MAIQHRKNIYQTSLEWIAKVTRSPQPPPELKNQDLIELLKKHRTSLARTRGVPAYHIFHNSTLTAMASNPPNDLVAMKLLRGVGDKKLADFGDGFLKVISDWQKGCE